MYRLLLSLAILCCLVSLYSFVMPDSSMRADSMTDPRDGTDYKTIKIGPLIWFQENLRYESPASVCYEDEAENCLQLGRMYNLNEARKACPPGWRLPTVKDWKSLRRVMRSRKFNSIAATTSWEIPEAKKANNKLGLSILAAGRRDDLVKHPEWKPDGNPYGEKGISASYWLDDDSIAPLHWHIRWGKSHIHKHGSFTDATKFSVRCVCEYKSP